MAHTLTSEVQNIIIAALARFLLSEESSYTTGQTMVASGGRVMLPGSPDR